MHTICSDNNLELFYRVVALPILVKVGIQLHGLTIVYHLKVHGHSSTTSIEVIYI